MGAKLWEESSNNSTVVTINSDSFCGICCCHDVVCHTGVHSLSTSCGFLPPKQHWIIACVHQNVIPKQLICMYHRFPNSRTGDVDNVSFANVFITALYCEYKFFWFDCEEENRNNVCIKIFVKGIYFLQILKTIILCECLACFYNNILFERSSYYRNPSLKCGNWDWKTN